MASEPGLPEAIDGGGGEVGVEDDNPLFFDPAHLLPLGDPDGGGEDDPLGALPVIPWPEPSGLSGDESEGPAVDTDDPMVQLALKVAPAVLTLRAWDEYGEEVTNGTGCFIEPGGTILTDANLVHPERAARIDYVTAVDGFGKVYRVSGVWSRSLSDGVTLLKTVEEGVPYLQIDAGFEVPVEGVAVKVIALKPGRGLALADAVARPEATVSGGGWLEVVGEDSAGAVGSPLLTADGRVVGMVSMRLPLEAWVNFGVPAVEIVGRLGGGAKQALPVKSLADTRFRRAEEDPKFGWAFRQLYAGHEKLAARELLRLTKFYPRSAACWALLGLAAAELGSPEEALACQRKAVALDPRVGDYWKALALAEMKVGGGGGRVEETLANAVERRPGDKLAWLLLAESRIRQGAYGPAAEALAQVVKLEPDFARAYYLSGYVQGKLGHTGLAAASLRRCLELDGRRPEAWYLYGLVMVEEGAVEVAVEAFERAVRHQRAHPKAWLNLAHAYRVAGRPNEAREAARRHFALLRAGRADG